MTSDPAMRQLSNFRSDMENRLCNIMANIEAQNWRLNDQEKRTEKLEKELAKLNLLLQEAGIACCHL